MTVVQVTTEQAPEMEGYLALRRERGLDTYDEWWEGVYRVVTGPSPEHGELIGDLMEFLGPLVRVAGLRKAAPVNIGIDKVECRVPDLAVYRPDTPRTSQAFLERAELVVEVLSPGERAGEKLPFYGAWGVVEYLEADPQRGTARLLRNGTAGTAALADWHEVNASGVLDFGVATDHLFAGDAILDLGDYRPQ